MSDDRPMMRQWKVLRTLSARRYGVAAGELAEELHVSVKTIRRDLEDLRTLGFPLEETVEGHGKKKWRIDEKCSLPTIPFTFEEAISLAMGRHLLEPLADTVFWSGAQRAFQKIQATLGSDVLRLVDRFDGMFRCTSGGQCDYRGKAEMIDTIMVGIEDSRAVEVAYQSLRATEPVTYAIQPYAFTYHRGALFVVGRRPGERKCRHWKINRMTKAQLTNDHFTRPADFDLAKHLANSFGIYQGDGEGNVTVKVAFAPQVARYVAESTWHASQKLTPRRDGSLLAEFELDSTEEIKRWIMGFGRCATVLEPATLRAELIEEFQASLRGLQADVAAAPPASSKRLKATVRG